MCSIIQISDGKKVDIEICSPKKTIPTERNKIGIAISTFLSGDICFVIPRPTLVWHKSTNKHCLEIQINVIKQWLLKNMYKIN